MIIGCSGSYAGLSPSIVRSVNGSLYAFDRMSLVGSRLACHNATSELTSPTGE